MHNQFDELTKGMAQSVTRRAALKKFRLSAIALASTMGCLPPASAAPAQQAYIKASNTGSIAFFGASVSLTGDTMVIGAPSESSNATGVNGNQTNNLASESGAVYVFVRNGTNWIQQAYIKASNTESFDRFGWHVAISGNTLVVGAPREDSSAIGVNGNQSDNSASGSGAAYIFVRNGTNWSQQAYLKASNTDANPVYSDDEFGHRVAISEDTVVVAAHYESSSATGVNGNQNDNSAFLSGAAYVFVRTGTNWSQQAYLKASNTEWADYFGTSVAVSGDTVVVGAYNESSAATGVNGNQSDNSASQSGAVYVFVRNGTNWAHQAYLKASNTGSGDSFGHHVAVEGDTVVVGAYGEASNATGVNGNQNDNSAGQSGAAYVFVRSGTNWTQQAYLKASNTEESDGFGYAVAIKGDTVVVGATGESSPSVGLNGNQTDDCHTPFPTNCAPYSGAAYVFVRAGTNWSQQAYLKASNTGAHDAFGGATAFSGGTVVVGAPYESSNATGVNGNQANNSATNSGAAYVFTGLGTVTRPRLDVARDGSGGYFIRFSGIYGQTYRLQRTTAITGPWSGIATNIAPPAGLVEYHEISPPPSPAFYRTVQP